MLTREVREWLQKVERRQYSYNDAMYEFMNFAKYLTKEELKQLKNKLEEPASNHQTSGFMPRRRYSSRAPI